MFMAGSPGATAHLHMRILGLFGMICRLPQNILHSIGSQKLFSESDSSSSWFVQVRKLCSKYNLPSPINLLSQPLKKESYKSMVKNNIFNFWETKYQEEAEAKPSLTYFKPRFHSLRHPHPLWTTCNNNSFEVNKSVVVARLLSGRYLSDWHCRHWSTENSAGICVLCPDKNTPGTMEHMLVACSALEDKRTLLRKHIHEQTEDNLELRAVITAEMSSTASTSNTVQFLLDPSVVLRVQDSVHNNKFTLQEVFAITRTYCYALHRRRLQMIGRFNFL